MTWTKLGEVTVDSRRRLSLGRAGLPKHKRYRVSQNSQGDILLQPVVTLLANGKEKRNAQ